MSCPLPFYLDVASPSGIETTTATATGPSAAAAAMNFLKRLFKNRSSDPSSVTRSASCSRDTLDRISNGGGGGDSDDCSATCSATECGRRTRSKSASRSSTPSGSLTSLPGVVLRPPPIITRTREVRMSSSKHLALILPGLLLGSQDFALDLHGLQHYNVTHILNVTIEVPERFPDRFIYRRIAISDMPSTKIVPYFDEAFRFIESGRSEGGVVLVHCYYGNSRSASFIIGYLIKVERMRYADSLEYLRILRPDVNPNDGFQRQLKEYEQIIFR